MATMQPSIIPPPREPLTFDASGQPSRTWFLFLQQLNTNAGDISNAAVITADDQTWSFPNSIILTPATGELERLLATGTYTLGLADSGVTAGAYGDASHLVKITIDAKGRATAAQEYALNSDNVTEGSTNLFFTQERARGALSGAGQVDYNSTTGVINTTGFSGTGPFTNFTFVNGICTAAS